MAYIEKKSKITAGYYLYSPEVDSETDQLWFPSLGELNKFLEENPEYVRRGYHPAVKSICWEIIIPDQE